MSRNTWEESVVKSVREMAGAGTVALRAGAFALFRVRTVRLIFFARHSSVPKSWKPLSDADPTEHSTIVVDALRAVYSRGRIAGLVLVVLR